MNGYFNNESLIICSLLLILTEQRLLLEEYKTLPSIAMGITSLIISYLFTYNILLKMIGVYILILLIAILKYMFLYYKLENYKK